MNLLKPIIGKSKYISPEQAIRELEEMETPVPPKISKRKDSGSKKGLEKLVSIQGLLNETYAQLKPETIQHADEITLARQKNKSLRNTYFWTADSNMYTVEKGEAFLYFGRRETNLVFKNLDAAITQILAENNYTPSKQDIELVKDSVKTGNTLKIKLSELDLIKDNDVYSHFSINTSEYSNLNQTQKVFAERVYGQGDNFKVAMKMFADANIASTNVYVLNPEYVKTTIASNAAHGALVRACRLGNFGYGSNFLAEYRDVDDDSGCLRGVSLVAPQAQER